jgi:hypothetical protein
MDCKNGIIEIIGQGRFGKGVAVCNLEFGILDLEFGWVVYINSVLRSESSVTTYLWIGRIVYLQFEEL